MEIKINRIYSVVVFLLCLFVSFAIVSDKSTSFVSKTLFVLPFAHGVIQFIRRNVETPITLLIRFTYFVRNVITPYLLIDVNYQVSFFSIKNESHLITIIILYVLETLLVYSYIYWKGKARLCIKEKKRNFSIRNSISYKLVFVTLFFLMILLFIVVPHTDLITRTVFDADAFISFNADKELLSAGRNRTLLSVYSYLVDTFRVILPAYLLVVISKNVKQFSLAMFFSIFVIMLQFLVITERTMITLIVIAVLGFLMYQLYPTKREAFLRIAGTVGVMFLVLVLGLKFILDDESDYDNYVANIVQAYFPGICNIQGVFNLPTDNNKIIISDALSMMPFRTTFMPLELVDSSPRMFNEYNDTRGQILPLIGQAYYHFGFLAPLVSVFFVRLAINAFHSSETKSQNYLHYIYYIYLSVFSAMMPCLYHFGVFVQTYFSSILILYFMSLINIDKKYLFKRKKNEETCSNLYGARWKLIRFY